MNVMSLSRALPVLASVFAASVSVIALPAFASETIRVCISTPDGGYSCTTAPAPIPKGVRSPSFLMASAAEYVGNDSNGSKIYVLPPTGKTRSDGKKELVYQVVRQDGTSTTILAKVDRSGQIETFDGRFFRATSPGMIEAVRRALKWRNRLGAMP